ncbi:hypothetical protein DL96DRAFT_1603184 [Flagelloscypha sp. PMI_526]|nr:hypothetical protein DL96DRAFT_1603184 [Flagelloscypha sp. PMI_526]
MSAKKPLSATNLAGHNTRSCDLYLYNIYHKKGSGIREDSEINKAHYQRGLEWEKCLLDWLDAQNLLLTVPSTPMHGPDLLENIYWDERNHFFISNLTFYAPQDQLNTRYRDEGFEPVLFGLAKPDLLEITRMGSSIEWRVIDAKASKMMKTSHQVQIYIYTEWLRYILPSDSFHPDGSAGIWLPPEDGFDLHTPSFSQLKTIDTALLRPSLDAYLYHQLPRLLSQKHDRVPWHLNPLCQGSRAVMEGKLGTIPNISLDEERILKSLLGIVREVASDQVHWNQLQKDYPTMMKHSQRLLAIPRKYGHGSPILKAAQTRQVQTIPQRVYTFPHTEDIAIVLSLIQDPALPGRILSGTRSLFTPLIRVSFLRKTSQAPKRLSYLLSQTFSSQSFPFKTSKTLLLGHRLMSSRKRNSTLCKIIFFSTFWSKGVRPKRNLRLYLERFGVNAQGTIAELKDLLKAEIARLKSASGETMELGQLPRVVVVKKEVGRLLALPIPGLWDLPELANVLLSVSVKSDDEVYEAYREADKTVLTRCLEQRNSVIFGIVRDVRKRFSPKTREMLVNEARVLSVHWLDVCREPSLRKLMFVQQFEILSRLQDLWKERIDGCPDAPNLTYKGPLQSKSGIVEHAFHLSAGTLDMPAGDKERTFYDFLLVDDTDGDDELPVEALFSDLPLAGLVFPLNRWTVPRWNAQHVRVRTSLALADLREMEIVEDPASGARETKVVIRVWTGAGGLKLVQGRRYRTSPRIVDFNGSKVLSGLVECDLRYSSSSNVAEVPFLQMILDPRSFSITPPSLFSGEVLRKEEGAIQRLFRELGNLDVAGAKNLVLKDSQREAMRRILTGRLSVVWGPPGTGKTYTLALSLLRLTDIERRLGDHRRKIVFLTAMTHAAISALVGKLTFLRGSMEGIESYQNVWLKKFDVQHVLKGSDHPSPPRSGEDDGITIVYAGTIWQLYNFSKRNSSIAVDTLIIDEAGQVSLSATALVFRSLTPNSRVVIAGDSEQLAPILAGSYPQMSGTRPLFGSILDCVMFSASMKVTEELFDLGSQEAEEFEVMSSQGTVVQLTENFRLNPDMGEFVSTIYSRKFKPQKVQARAIALALGTLHEAVPEIKDDIERDTLEFLVALSSVMIREPQTMLEPPSVEASTLADAHHLPVSLSLIELKTISPNPEGPGYELHVQAEARLGVALVTWLRRCCPNETIFVATPHRVQRQAVKAALRKMEQEEGLEATFHRLDVGESKVTVDTVERLQGENMGLFYVAISRSKTLCIAVSSKEVLRPSLRVLGNEESVKGYGFLKAYEARAWKTRVSVAV